MTRRPSRTRAACSPAPVAVSPKHRQPGDRVPMGAPSRTDNVRLIKLGLSRAGIRTAQEVADLLSCAGLRPDHVKVLAKIELGGEVVVRRR